MATYGSETGVQAIVPAVGVQDNDSTPTDAQLAGWLAEGYSLINQTLAAAGYVIPVASSVALYPSLRALNDLYGAAYVLRSRGMDVVQGEEESRSEMYLKDFFRRLAMLATQDLTALGLTLRTSPTAARRGVRTLQLRRVDGYSATVEGTGYPAE